MFRLCNQISYLHLNQFTAVTRYPHYAGESVDRENSCYHNVEGYMGSLYVTDENDKEVNGKQLEEK